MEVSEDETAVVSTERTTLSTETTFKPPVGVISPETRVASENPIAHGLARCPRDVGRRNEDLLINKPSQAWIEKALHVRAFFIKSL